MAGRLLTAGQLTARVTLQTRVESLVGGVPVVTWTDLASVWASKRATGLVAGAAGELPRRAWEVFIRSRRDVLAAALPLRVLHTHDGVTDILLVNGILPDDALRDQLRLDCIDGENILPPINPTDLNRPIAIEQLARTDDGGGGQVYVWSLLAAVDAKIETPSGRELEVGRLQVPELTHRLTIAFRADVTAAHRVKYGTRVFSIHAVVDPGEVHEQLLLLCSEVSATDATVAYE